MNTQTALLIIEKSPDAIVIQTQGLIRYANPAACKLFGVDSEETLLGMKLIDQVDDQYRQVAETRLDSLLNQGVDFTEPVERLYHRIDGSTVWVELVGERIVYQGLEGTVIFFRNIQKRKKLEQLAKESEQFYRSILDSLPLSIVHFSPEPKIFFVNNHYSGLFGWKDGSSDPEETLQTLYPDPNIRHEVEQFIEAATGAWKVFPVRTKTGDQRQFEWCNIGLENGTRISIGIDVTENLRAQTTIKELLQVKERLLREVHHRIKNNMVTMTSLLTLQSEMTESTEVASQLVHARNRMRTMAALYEHLNRSGNLEQVPLGGYLEPLIQEIVENLDPPFPVDLNVQLVDVDIPVPRASLLGIIANEIITNSIIHGFPMGGECRLALEGTLESELVTLVFKDNGIGCDLLHQPTNGLGTQLVSLLVEQLNGSVELEVQEGTTITIRFPLT